MLERIIRKAIDECDGRVSIALYNWTEPFLHPRLHEMVRVVTGHGLPCGLSSNLNLLRNIDEVMEANPTYLKVSVSGFEQSSYGITHRLGDIEKVKENMRRVAEARDRAHATTRLEVPFHRYLGNHEQEAQMSEFAMALGYEMTPVWAYMTSLEKALAYIEPSLTDVSLTDEDRELMARLALPMDEALDVARKTASSSCRLRDRQLAINCEGYVTLCCTVFDPVKYGISSYLETPLSEIQLRKSKHQACDGCMKHGIHNLFMYEAAEAFDEIALANVARHYPDVRLTGMAERKKRSRGIRGIPRKIKKRWHRLSAMFRSA